jgi:hypothetical protein
MQIDTNVTGYIIRFYNLLLVTRSALIIGKDNYWDQSAAR